MSRRDPCNSTRYWWDRHLSGLSLLCADFTTHEYPPHAHEARGAKQAQLMRHGRLGEPHEGGKITHAALAMRQGIDQAHPRRIAQELEDLCDRLDRPDAEQARLHLGQIARVRQMALVARQITIGIGFGMDCRRGHDI